MLKKILAGLVVGVMVIGLSSQVMAMGSQPEKRFGRLAKELGLSKEQKEKYQKSVSLLEEKFKLVRGKNQELRQEIEKELAKDSPDSKVIKDYMVQISQNNNEIQFARMEQIINLRKELTPEQKEKFNKFIQARKEWGGKRRGK